MIGKLRSVVGVVLLLGCEKDPVGVSRTNNPHVFVETLFEHEGCKVYRFQDNGRAHYYVRCSDGRAVVRGGYSSGDKNNSVVYETIETVR